MVNMAVRDPLGDMRSLMRRVFDEDWSNWPTESSPLSAMNGRNAGIPLDVYEAGDVLTVEAMLPGFSKDAIDVTFERGKLTIRAERSAPGDAEQRNYFVREQHPGVFSRSLLVGDSYDPDSLHGSYTNGVLTITVHKAAEAQPRTIQIED